MHAKTLPEQTTEASSACVQVWSTLTVQSNKELSFPAQSTPSKAIAPVPSPKADISGALEAKTFCSVKTVTY